MIKKKFTILDIDREINKETENQDIFTMNRIILKKVIKLLVKQYPNI